MLMETSKLKEYKFNKEFFDALPKSEYAALKNDIKERGIQNDLHILEDFTVICGNQRLLVARELGLEKVPVKIIVQLETPEIVKEYVIKDNLLRRQLSKEQQYMLFAELSKVYETGRGGDRKTEDFKDATVASMNEEDVNEKTAKETGVSARTIATARQYSELVKAEPKRFKGKKVTQVLREVKKEKQVETIQSQDFKPPKGKFNIIVIDPPWPGTGAYDPDGFRGQGDYPTMSFEELEQLKLPSADDCVLWLWGIDLHLKETLDLIEKWGFTRKSTLIWDKQIIGLGHWLRNQHEYCFLCVKGKPVFHGESISSVLNVKRLKHSEKPQEFYGLVEKASPYKDKLDYFARKKRKGWTVFGDEVKE